MKAEVHPAMSSALAAVSIRGVGKAFGTRFQALSNIDLDIEDGQFLSIVGPSGCGKSTLLLVVAGLASASTGQVILGSTPIVGPWPREVAVVFQDALLLPSKTTLQNVEFPL